MVEMRTTPASRMQGTGWAAEGDTGTTEEAAGGVIRAAWGMKVEAKVVGVTCGVKGEVEIIVVARGAGEVVRVIRRVIGPSEGVVEPSAYATWTVRPPSGAVRPLGGTAEPLRGGRSDCLGWQLDHQPLQRGWLDCLRVWSDRQPWSSVYLH
jgi:hypothetical protein